MLYRSVLVPMYTLILSCHLGCGGDSPLLNHGKHQAKVNMNSGEDEAVPQQPLGTLSSSDLNLQLSAFWRQGPYGDPRRETQLLLALVDLNTGLPKDLGEDYEIFVYGWMPSMGHGTAHDGFIRHIETGTYVNEGMYFNMPGEWLVIIEIYGPNDQILATTQIEVRL